MAFKTPDEIFHIIKGFSGNKKPSEILAIFDRIRKNGTLAMLISGDSSKNLEEITQDCKVSIEAYRVKYYALLSLPEQVYNQISNEIWENNLLSTQDIEKLQESIKKCKSKEIMHDVITFIVERKNLGLKIWSPQLNNLVDRLNAFVKNKSYELVPIEIRLSTNFCRIGIDKIESSGLSRELKNEILKREISISRLQHILQLSEELILFFGIDVILENFNGVSCFCLTKIDKDMRISIGKDFFVNHGNNSRCIGLLRQVPEEKLRAFASSPIKNEVFTVPLFTKLFQLPTEEISTITMSELASLGDKNS